MSQAQSGWEGRLRTTLTSVLRELPRLCAGLVGVVLIVAGWGKLSAPGPTEQVLAWAGLALPLPKVITGVLPGVEFGLGLTLLLLAFTGVLISVALGRYGGDCGCLGPIIDSWSGGPVFGIARNVALLGLLAWPTVLAFRAGRPTHVPAPTRRRAASTTARMSCFLGGMFLSGMAVLHAVADIPRITTPWSSQFETPMRSDFTETRVDRIAKWFDMTEDQKTLLEELHQAHQARFTAFLKEYGPIRDHYDQSHHELQSAVRDGQGDALALQELTLEREEELAKVADRQHEVDMTFLADIQMILNDAQMERWDRFRMWLNRDRWLGRLFFYLEQPVDLIALLNEVNEQFPDDLRTVPEQIIDAYARNMDRALRDLADFDIEWSRTRHRGNSDRYRTDGEKVWIGSSNDPSKERQRDRENETRLETRRKVRDVNHRYEAIFASNLPASKTAAWETAYRETVLRRVNFGRALSEEAHQFAGRSRSVPAFERLRERIRAHVPNLNSDQENAITATIAQRNTLLNTAFRRIVLARDEASDSSFRSVSPVERKALEEAYLESLRALVQIEEKACRNLMAILRPGQAALLDTPSVQPDK